MKNCLFLFAFLSAGIAMVATGCSRKPSATGELEKAAAILQKSETSPLAPAQPAPMESPAPAPNQPAQPATSPAQQMSAAIVAYKGGNLEDAVIRLQKLRATPVMAPEQRIVVNDAIASVMNEIGAMAAKGDARAIAAAKQYEFMQTKRN